MSNSGEEVPLFDREPFIGGWANIDLFDDFLRWAVTDQEASDVKITPNGPVFLSIGGLWYPVTRRAPSVPELGYLIDTCSRRSNASARAASGHSEDFSYEITKLPDDRRSGNWRFRGNATACAFGREKGLSITMRAIPDKIPTLEELNVAPSLIEHLFPKHGLVSISGVMGSGKTTTMASIMSDIRTKTQRSLMTLEKPIEFDLTNISGAKGPIEQIEVPTMIESFYEGVVSATRKAVNVLLVGETNDTSTMAAMVHAGEVGIAVYHTLHTKSVPGVPGRIIHEFTQDERAGISVSYLDSVSVIIQQRLVPMAGHKRKRVALREWLVLDDAMRREAIDSPPERLNSLLDKMVRSKGRHILDEAADALRDGLIDRATLRNIEIERK